MYGELQLPHKEYCLNGSSRHRMGGCDMDCSGSGQGNSRVCIVYGVMMACDILLD
jgi:hypothetical protein